MAYDRTNRTVPGHTDGAEIIPVRTIVAVAWIVQQKFVYASFDHLANTGSHSACIGAVIPFGGIADIQVIIANGIVSFGHAAFHSIFTPGPVGVQNLALVIYDSDVGRKRIQDCAGRFSGIVVRQFIFFRGFVYVVHVPVLSLIVSAFVSQRL